MRKQWTAVLSVLGFAGPVAQAQTPMVKKPQQPVRGAAPAGPVKPIPGPAKLNVKQQTLRTQTPVGNPGGKQADTMTPSAYCNGAKAAGANNGSTKVQTTAVTKGSNAVTKGNNAVTKGAPAGQAKPGALNVNQQKLRTQTPAVGTGGKQADTMTPSAYCAGAKQGAVNNNAVTKGNAAVTKGNNAVTKGNAAVTKGGNAAVTKGSNVAVTKGSAVTRAVTK